MIIISENITRSILNKPARMKLTRPRRGPRKMPKNTVPMKAPLKRITGPRRTKKLPPAKTPRMKK